MRGLLIKDYKLLSVQKLSVIFIFAMGIFFIFTQDSPIFGISYTLAVTSIYTLTTINYDEFDNGMEFLMTLPSGRKLYALEKYVLVFCNILIVSIILTALGGIQKVYSGESGIILELIEMSVSGTLTYLILSSALLPVYLKFGAEKSRIVLIAIAGCFIAASFIFSSVLSANNILDTSSLLNTIYNLSPAQIIITLFLAVIICLGVSIKISLKILEKKEY